MFVGCVGAFDDRIKKTMRALVEVLQGRRGQLRGARRAEQCIGDPARRAGNEYLFQILAQTNIERLNQYSAERRIVASCPHCFNTLKNEYPQLGGKYDVIHHSELLAHLLAEVKLDDRASGGAS